MMRRPSLISLLVKHCRAWLRDRRGGVAVTLTVAVPVLIMLVGLAVDYAQAERVRGKLQNAADVASLSLARLGGSYANPRAAARRFVKANLADADFDLSSLKVKVKVNSTPHSQSAEVSVSASPKLFFAKFFSKNAFDIDVKSSSREEYQNLEIALVLDVSASMNSNSKIGNLRVAATEFLKIVLKSPLHEQFTTISIVPYSSDVKLSSHFAKFLNPSQRAGWNGCLDLGKRTLSGQVLPIGSMLATPDIFGSGSICPPGPGTATFRQNKLTALRAHVQALTPGGHTSTDMATQWGLSALTPEWRPHLPGPVTAAPRNFNRHVSKTLVIMTDGAINAPYRRVAGVAQPLYDVAFAMNRFRHLCTTAKDKGVEVYTIGFEVSQKWMLDLLQECASSSSHYFNPQGTAISDVFKAIAFRLSPLRLVN